MSLPSLIPPRSRLPRRGKAQRFGRHLCNCCSFVQYSIIIIIIIIISLCIIYNCSQFYYSEPRCLLLEAPELLQGLLQCRVVLVEIAPAIEGGRGGREGRRARERERYFCVSMLGRADIEGSTSNLLGAWAGPVAGLGWLP